MILISTTFTLWTVKCLEHVLKKICFLVKNSRMKYWKIWSHSIVFFVWRHVSTNQPIFTEDLWVPCWYEHFESHNCLWGHLEWSCSFAGCCWSTADTCSRWTVLSYLLAKACGVSLWLLVLCCFPVVPTTDLYSGSEARPLTVSEFCSFLKARYNSSCFCHLWLPVEFQIKLCHSFSSN